MKEYELFYLFLLTKGKRVIESCTNIKQLKVAKRYNHLLIVKYGRLLKINSVFDSLNYFTLEHEVNNYFDNLIKAQEKLIGA